MAIKTKSNISVLSLLVQPYCPSSSIATDFPSFELFSDRTQFIPFERLSHLAVSLEFFNLLFDNPRHRKARKSFFINVRDSISHEIIASRTVCVQMDSDTMRCRQRVDLPLRRSQIVPDRLYKVEVTAPGCEYALISRDLLFLNITRLPTRYYSAVGGWMSKYVFDNEGEPHTLRLTASSDLQDGMSVTFFLENNVTDAAHRPELFMKFFGEDDSCIIRPCCLTGYEENGVSYVRAECDIPSILQTEGFLYVELLSMGYHFAGAVFELSSADEEGELCGEDLEFITDFRPDKALRILEKRRGEMSYSIQEESSKEPSLLDSLIGLEGVKAKLEGYRKLMWFFRQRRKLGLPVPATPLHCLFLGSPGTGKTTVAKELGHLLHDCGALSKGHVVVRERANLLGQFYNSESEKTLAALEEAKGGILFIDEAYQLHQPADPKDPGRFVLESLMTALADSDNRDWMLILAGYTEPMLKMMSLNPGLSSRIPEVNFYRFEDFSAAQLQEIALSYFGRSHFVLTDEARGALSKRIATDYATRDETFGNARYVVNLIETEILPAMAARLSEISSPNRVDLSTIRSSDIPDASVRIVAEKRRIGFAS